MKYRKDKTTNKKFLGSLVGNGVTAIASSLGADEQTAKMIGSGVGAVTGFATGDIVGGVAESGRFIGGATMNDDNLSEYGNLLEGGSSIASSFIQPKAMFAGGSLPNISADINPMNGIQQFKNMRLLANGGSVKPESMGKEMNALNSLTEYNEGGLHEQNPDGGVVLGNQNASVEEGEVQWNDFIFSNRINADEQVLSEYSLNKSYAGLTFADIAKKIQNKYKLRDNDPFTTEAENRELQRLADAHEAFKQVNMPEQSQEQPIDMQQMNPEMLQSMETPMGMENIQPEMGMEQSAQPQQFAYGGKKYNDGGPLGFGVKLQSVNTQAPFNLNQAKQFASKTAIQNLNPNSKFANKPALESLNPNSSFVNKSNAIPSSVSDNTENSLNYGMQGSDYVKAGLAGANTIARLVNNQRVSEVEGDRYAIKGLTASRVNVDPALSEANLAFNSLDETINQNATNALQVIAGRGNSAIKRARTTSAIRTQEDNRRVQKQDELNALMAQSAVQSQQMADNINMGNEITYRQNMDTIIGDAAQTGIGITEQASNRSMMKFLASKGYYNQNYLPGAKKTTN